jgi:hypothetical protein
MGKHKFFACQFIVFSITAIAMLSMVVSAKKEQGLQQAFKNFNKIIGENASAFIGDSIVYLMVDKRQLIKNSDTIRIVYNTITEPNVFKTQIFKLEDVRYFLPFFSSFRSFQIYRVFISEPYRQLQIEIVKSTSLVFNARFDLLGNKVNAALKYGQLFPVESGAIIFHKNYLFIPNNACQLDSAVGLLCAGRHYLIRLPKKKTLDDWQAIKFPCDSITTLTFRNKQILPCVSKPKLTSETSGKSMSIFRWVDRTNPCANETSEKGKLGVFSITQKNGHILKYYFSRNNISNQLSNVVKQAPNITCDGVKGFVNNNSLLLLVDGSIHDISERFYLHLYTSETKNESYINSDFDGLDQVVGVLEEEKSNQIVIRHALPVTSTIHSILIGQIDSSGNRIWVCFTKLNTISGK